MAVTFDAARALVDAEERPRWRPENGTFHVSESGFEDETHWLVVVGAREFLVDDDLAFAIPDDVTILVDKATGAISRLSAVANLDRLGAMTPVNAP